MKRVIIFFYFSTIAIASFGQGVCSKNNAVYKFGQNETPKEIQRFGTAPEFAFLGNLSTTQQFVTAMHKQQGKGVNELNDILMGIGFEHGAKDVKASAVTSEQLADGIVGNMGDAAHNYVYAKLEGNRAGVRAWKVTSDNGCFVYFIAKCGNAFYPQPVTAAAPEAAAAEEPQPSPEVAQPVCKDKVYIYYGGIKKRHHGWDIYANDIALQKCTNPADNSEMTMVSDEPVKVYTDASDINVERTGTYLGYRKVERRDDRESKKEFNREYKHRKYCGCGRE